MEITKVVKPFIRRGWPNMFGNIVCVCVYIYIYSYSYNYLQVKEYDIWMYFAWKFTTLIKMHFSFFVQTFVFLMCIQVVIKHEHMKIE